ncbi:MAG: CCA tRNA nucleotidyltransferase [Candidatus Cloacimonadales bacterium]
MKKSKITPSDISKIEAKIAATLRGSLFANHVYLVGGVVRDQLLQRPTNDLDLVVDLPNGGIRLAEYLHQQKLASHPKIFKRFGTALIQIDQIDLELVMTRREFYSNNSRKPEVKVGSLADDAIRRDFTINALYRPLASNEILDLTGMGLADLQAKILRTTNDPQLVFSEDPLRLLRAIRFAAQLDFQIEQSCWQAIKELHAKLANISKERIRDELCKTLLAKNPARGFSLLRDSSLLAYIIGDFSSLDQAGWQQLLAKLEELPDNLEFRLAIIAAALFAKSYPQTLAALKFSKATIRQVDFLIKNSHILENDGWQNLTEADWRYWLLKWQEASALLVDFAEHNSDLVSQDKEQKFNEMRKTISQIKLPDQRFPINGNIIKQRFPHLVGKEIGVALAQAYRIWLENPEAKPEDIFKIMQKGI